ncbi:MAG: M3 family metallopeptidase [Planctomycetes bacterium]|nr:M3 family metallopeptidase [Planctomycetota bacterium]
MTPTTLDQAPALPDNPLLAEWQGPFGGVPPFDRVAIADFAPAIEAAMAHGLWQIEQIANDPAPPTFDNTIAALERTGRPLERVMAVYGVWGSNMSSPDFQAVERVIDPELAAYHDKIRQNAALFRRIEAVYESPAKEALTAEQQRLLWKLYTDFARGGARLDEAGKARLSAINQQLARLFTDFSQNVLADESDRFLVLESEGDLQGMPASLIDAAAAAASRRQLPGRWVIDNTRSSNDPFLTYSTRRDLRERAWRLFPNRGAFGDEHDNNALIPQILQLRAERASLLGYATHAHWRLENSMAKSPERALGLIEALWTPAIARVAEEVADMQQLADAEAAGITIAPWDYAFYAEKVRQARYDLDQAEVKQYLQLEKLREGMFWVAGELFGFDFVPAPEVPVYHPDVRVWEVKDKDSGRHVGLWYFDPYARPGKRSGAWMTDYRAQQRLDGDIATLVSNNENFVKGKAGEPVLISWDDATTLFHEFGHALHGLCSNVTYPTLSGTNVTRDFVEFPSQLLEHWLSTDAVLQGFARHHETDAPIPQALVDRIAAASTFNQGFATTEYLASALVDMKMHTAAPSQLSTTDFEKEVLDAAGMPGELVMRHRPTHFLHVFANDGYSAGYYSYLWADTLVADAWQAFAEAGSPYDKKLGQKLLRDVFARGNTVDPAAAYRAFRGRDAGVEALMKKRGFAAGGDGGR